MLTYNCILFYGGKATTLVVVCLLEQIQRTVFFIFVLVSLKKHIHEPSLPVLWGSWRKISHNRHLLNDALDLDIYGAQYDAEHLTCRHNLQFCAINVVHESS